jgi:putative tryptophan/tyrosine transport system substrate-binding protein
MRRRELLLLLVGGLTVARTLRAQQKAMPVIGLLGGVSPGGPFPLFVAALREGLSETGYVEGQNVSIEYRWAEGNYDRLPALATDLVARKVDVILALGDEAAHAAKRATSTIPIVFLIGADPIVSGLVGSLARPGANLTGVTFMMAELTPKRLELLSELVPRAGVIALLVNPNNVNAERNMQDAQDAARAKGVQLPILKAGTDREIDDAFADLVRLHAGALLVAADPFFGPARPTSPTAGRVRSS